MKLRRVAGWGDPGSREARAGATAVWRQTRSRGGTGQKPGRWGWSAEVG